MNGGAGHRKVGGDAAGMTDADRRHEEMKMLDKMLKFFEREEIRQQNSEERGRTSDEHNKQVSLQYYRFRSVSVIIALIAPWVIFPCVFAVLNRADVVASVHPAAQALLVSGAFLSFIVLYGILLREVFRGPGVNAPKNKLAESVREDSESDYEKQRKEFLPEFLDFIRRYKDHLGGGE
ncbi:MAG: hypothetical protein ACR2QC_09915 [Gammaproteobacteria bacterium]